MPTRKLRLPSVVRSLSARLLVLTVFFVMLIEVFVYAPSIARYRKTYLEERIADAHLATLALQAAPDQMVAKKLETQLLDHARAYAVVTRRAGLPKLALMRDMPPKINKTVDLRKGSFMMFTVEAFETLMQSENRILRVLGPSPKDRTVLIEVLLDETPLRAEMIAYSKRILVLSLIISFFTAVLVYLTLHWLMVRPMRKLTENMTEFADRPEDEDRLIVPTNRTDEIGVAQRQLLAMQKGLRGALRQKARLAALGAAVTKINHDLRNILSTASLISDRLADTKDPKVRRVAPTLVRAIDRAVVLCTDTLDFARSDTITPKKDLLPLRQVIDEVATGLPITKTGGQPSVDIAFDDGFQVLADRNHLYRALSNLGNNAVQAGAVKLSVSARRRNGRIAIDIADDGPGLPPVAQDSLFEPFAGSTRTGGSGLGLAIARELAQAHGGDLSLLETSEEGTVFRLELPTR